MCNMSIPENAAVELEQRRLEEKLRDVDERLQNEMRRRGFDPAQDENIALPGPLAKLYMERENLRQELNTLSAVTDPTAE